jgi:hypothetical protein
MISAALSPDQHLDVYISHREHPPTPFWTEADFALRWSEQDLYYDWKPSNDRVKDVNISLAETQVTGAPCRILPLSDSSPCRAQMLSNRSMFAHAYIFKDGHSPDPTSPLYAADAVLLATSCLTFFKAPKKVDLSRNLLADSGPAEPTTAVQDLRPVLHWNPVLTLNTVYDVTIYEAGMIPEPVKKRLVFEADGSYKPVMYVNDFWTMQEHLIAINDTVAAVPLKLSYSTMGALKWQMMVGMQEQWAATDKLGTSKEGDKDELKRMCDCAIERQYQRTFYYCSYSNSPCSCMA